MCLRTRSWISLRMVESGVRSICTGVSWRDKENNHSLCARCAPAPPAQQVTLNWMVWSSVDDTSGVAVSPALNYNPLSLAFNAGSRLKQLVVSSPTIPHHWIATVCPPLDESAGSHLLPCAPSAPTICYSTHSAF